MTQRQAARSDSPVGADGCHTQGAYPLAISQNIESMLSPEEATSLFSEGTYITTTAHNNSGPHQKWSCCYTLRAASSSPTSALGLPGPSSGLASQSNFRVEQSASFLFLGPAIFFWA